MVNQARNEGILRLAIDNSSSLSSGSIPVGPFIPAGTRFGRHRINAGNTNTFRHCGYLYIFKIYYGKMRKLPKQEGDFPHFLSGGISAGQRQRFG